jgi:NitT/TauT family transport system permease protein
MRLIRRHSWVLGLLTIAALIGLWQIAATSGWVNRQLVPSASAVLTQFVMQGADASFYVDLMRTLSRVLTGFMLATIIGVPVGLFMGYWASAENALSVTVNALRPLPSTAVVPLAAAVFGIQSGMHIFIVTLATTIPILLATKDGVHSVDSVLIGTARTLGQSTSRIFRTVLLPAALPSIITGLRVSIAIALVVGISSEMIMSPDGLGHRVMYAQRLLQITNLYAGVLTLAALGYVLNQVFRAIERWLLIWHCRTN